MKITKKQLKRIIREERSRLQRRGLIREMTPDEALKQYQDGWDAPDAEFGMANNHLGLLSRAVEACLAKGMTPDEICEMCEEECLKQDVHRDQF